MHYAGVDLKASTLVLIRTFDVFWHFFFCFAVASSCHRITRGPLISVYDWMHFYRRKSTSLQRINRNKGICWRWGSTFSKMTCWSLTGTSCWFFAWFMNLPDILPIDRSVFKKKNPCGVFKCLILTDLAKPKCLIASILTHLIDYWKPENDYLIVWLTYSSPVMLPMLYHQVVCNHALLKYKTPIIKILHGLYSVMRQGADGANTSFWNKAQIVSRSQSFQLFYDEVQINSFCHFWCDQAPTALDPGSTALREGANHEASKPVKKKQVRHY